MGRKQIAAIFGLLSMAAMGGCVSESGPVIDHAKMDSLVKGVSTKADAEAALGMPNGSQSQPDGTTQLVYTHSTVNTTPFPMPGAGGITWEECRLHFDQRGFYAGSECNATASNPSTR